MPFKGNGNSTQAAVEALNRGYTAIPIRDGGKRPYGGSWTHIRWENADQVTASFNGWIKEGASGVGLLLGAPSSGLIDVDIDHPKALRLRRFLPETAMKTGRAGNQSSHFWYRVSDDLPSSRPYKMPNGSVSIELRSTGAQTLIPPTIHPSGESYRWEGEPWGGEEGPRVIGGKQIALAVAILGMGAVIIDNWPHTGSRHEAFLALAGGLLRYGPGVHPYWERNLPDLIRAIAIETNDQDGPNARVSEVMETTLKRLREPEGKAVGFPKLAEIVGVDHAEQIRRLSREVESIGWISKSESLATLGTRIVVDSDALQSTLPDEKRNPLTERNTSWDTVDLWPYILKEIVQDPPSILKREDGKGLMYPGLVNLLFGKSESAKSWVALHACVQEMATSTGRVIYVDLEDGPAGTIGRLLKLGVGDDDIANQFHYILPDSPLAPMQKSMFGGSNADDEGKSAQAVFEAKIKAINPTLIVIDGMTVLYGIHGHNTNDATATAFITNWLKSLCINGATVIVIDHTGKGEGGGASPIGAHHKIAMVQGTALRIDVIDKPMPGKKGSVKLVVFKDRPGSVRAISGKPLGNNDEQVAGIVTLDSTVEGITHITIEPPKDGDVILADSDSMDRKMGKLGFDPELQEKILTLFDAVADPDRQVTSKQVYEAFPELSGHPNMDKEFPARTREAWGALVERRKVQRFETGPRTYYVWKPSS